MRGLTPEERWALLQTPGSGVEVEAHVWIPLVERGAWVDDGKHVTRTVLADLILRLDAAALGST